MLKHLFEVFAPAYAVGLGGGLGLVTAVIIGWLTLLLVLP